MVYGINPPSTQSQTQWPHVQPNHDDESQTQQLPRCEVNLGFEWRWIIIFFSNVIPGFVSGQVSGCTTNATLYNIDPVNNPICSRDSPLAMVLFSIYAVMTYIMLVNLLVAIFRYCRPWMHCYIVDIESEYSNYIGGQLNWSKIILKERIGVSSFQFLFYQSHEVHNWITGPYRLLHMLLS